MENWLGQTETPLFVSRRRLAVRKGLPRAVGRWVLDSGGFTELNLYGRWETSLADYAVEARRYADEIGGLDWVAPMDWMCEPSVVAKTGLSVTEHQLRTIENYLALRDLLGDLVVPVVQGWTTSEYERCVEMYSDVGIDLYALPVVGVGSICRRGSDGAIGQVIRALQPINCHAFGVRGKALRNLSDVLVSADSMAWSYNARRNRPLPGCTHKSCQNCLIYAERWYARTVQNALSQTRLEFV